MTQIRAPYNFAPINEDVYLPHWGQHIYHDIPFRNGISGYLILNILAENPIFVRGGGQESESDIPLKFSNINDKYFIPGSSLKGMLRAVTEILSFSKFQSINDHKFGVRDFTNNNIYPLIRQSGQIRCGWLKHNENNTEFPFMILESDIANSCKVKHQDIRVDDTDFDVIFSGNHPNILYNNKDEREENTDTGDSRMEKGNDQTSYKSARYKYEVYSKNKQIEAVKLFPEDEEIHYIFTGQPNYNQDNGKKHEFKFRSPQNCTEEFKVTQKLFEDFLHSNADHDENKISDHWKFFKPRFIESKLPIPVFFRKDNKGNVLDFGLCVLYKLPYKFSVRELAERNQNINKYEKFRPDLTECIFGFTDDKDDEKAELREISKEENQQTSQKSRVFVEHAFAEGSPNELQPVETILLGPKATYYPTYIRQDVQPNGQLKNDKNGGIKKYDSMMKEDAKLAGYKRYPIHHNFINPVNHEGNQNNDVKTSFTPLDAGTRFTTKLHFHNLRPEEIGALLSAITFHKHSSCRHSIGMAKPLGYGRIKVDIAWEKSTLNLRDQDYYLDVFESTMNQFLKVKQWIDSSQVKELLSMSNVNYPQDVWKLTNMILSNDDNNRVNEFVQIKEENKGLPLFSSFMEGSVPEIRSIASGKVENDESLFSRNWKNEAISMLDDLINKEKSSTGEKLEKIEETALTDTLDNLKRNIDSEIRMLIGKDEGLASLQGTQEFDTMVKKMKPWTKTWHKKNYNKIRLEIKGTDQFLIPIELMEEFMQILRVVRDAEEEKGGRPWNEWTKPLEKNNNFKEVCIWIGPDRATQFFEEILKRPNT